MKTLKQVEKDINDFKSRYGVDLLSAQQGSTAWLQSRLGVITASEVSDAVAKIGSKTRFTYLCKLVSEVATGYVEEINSKHLEWGRMHESAARASYEFKNDCKIEQVGFIFKDNTFREGASLDGFIVGQERLVEIKCPSNPVNYIKFLVEDQLKAEYMWQYQYQMRITGAEVADFVQYDPRMAVSPLKILTVKRDEEYQKEFDDKIPLFLSDMDHMLKDIGIEYGSQWKRLANKESAGVA